MGRKKGKVIFYLTGVMAVFLATAAFSQPPQPKMERMLEELRELRKKVEEMEEKEEVC